MLAGLPVHGQSARLGISMPMQQARKLGTFMRLSGKQIFYGWWVTIGCSLVVFGVAGGQFSFGVFMKPMTEEFGWSRGTLSAAFGVTYLISGLMRPFAGYLADRYSPKWVALTGVLVMGWMLALISSVQTLWQLYGLFAVMSLGVTLGTGPILTKIVSQWFMVRRGLTLGLVSGAGSFGAMILVPATSAFLVLFSWREAYVFLGILLLLLILPIGILLIRDRPEDKGLRPYGSGDNLSAAGGQRRGGDVNFSFMEAVRTPMFQRLTFGYFV